MHVRKLALAAFLVGTGSAHAQFGMSPMMTPMNMMGPMTMMAPLGMAGMGMMGGGMGMGGMNPMTMMGPMTMMAAPMMMPMGASMMSAQMYQPQSMMNPYLNPMAASNPYLNQSAGMGNPFMRMPSAPAPAAPMAFFPMMQPAPAAVPAPAAAAPKTQTPAPAAVSNPFDPAMWMQMMGGMPNAPATPK